MATQTKKTITPDQKLKAFALFTMARSAFPWFESYQAACVSL